MTLYVVSSNMPGYLPNDDAPFIGHADADTLVSVLADLIVRDGESSIESIMSDPDSYDTEDEQSEEAAGDSGMIELWEENAEAHQEALQDVREALAHNEEFVYSYTISWNDVPHDMVYFIQATDAEHCSDETCEECTIMVKAQHADSQAARNEAYAWLGGNARLSDSAALAIASYWQSSGYEGKHLAALASGASDWRSDVLDDAKRTRAKVASAILPLNGTPSETGWTHADIVQLDALIDWIETEGSEE